MKTVWMLMLLAMPSFAAMDQELLHNTGEPWKPDAQDLIDWKEFANDKEVMALTYSQYGSRNPIWQIAGDGAAPPAVLARLVKSKNKHVRMNLADNYNADAKTYILLAHDKDDQVREHLAGLYSVPTDVQDSMVEDKDREVIWRLANSARNPKTLERIMERFSEDSEILYNVAINHHLTKEQIERLSKSRFAVVKEAIQGRTGK